MPQSGPLCGTHADKEEGRGRLLVNYNIHGNDELNMSDNEDTCTSILEYGAEAKSMGPGTT